MKNIRSPAVAGQFYPDNPTELRSQISHFLQQAHPAGQAPKALIAPHAGYIYSGPVAASAYASLLPAKHRIHKVVLLGPAHRVPFLGLAAPTSEGFATPLGVIPIDQQAIDSLADLPQVRRMDLAHEYEHSLEVQLPFLQSLLDDFTLVPLVVGDASPEEVAEVLERLWGGEETLILISSDLSHYHDYATAQRMDSDTSQAIEHLEDARITHQMACGGTPVRGLLQLARKKGMHAHTLDLRNSGDTAGPRDQVVGYGAYAIN